MVQASREFQVFVKPVGALCNLGCRYCYYLEKERLYPEDEEFKMTDETLEDYIAQHIDASPEAVVRFSWHGGEPTVLGLDYFRRVVELQRKHQPSDRSIVNGIQTNGTLLDEEWCRFFAREGFAVGLSLAWLGTSIWFAVAVIGVVTAALTTAGMYLGRMLGARFGRRMSILGGLVLVGIGVKILVDHLG